MTWGTGGRAQHSIEAVLGTCFGEPVLPCLMAFQGFLSGASFLTSPSMVLSDSGVNDMTF